MPAGGALLKWHRALGQPVTEGDLLCEVETDKTVMSIEAEASGVLAQILIEAGASGVAAGETLARIDQGSRDIESACSLQIASATNNVVTSFGIDGKGRLAASPRARRLASEGGVDLSNIEGTGPGGRIVERDIIKARAYQRSASHSPASGCEKDIFTQQGGSNPAVNTVGAQNHADIEPQLTSPEFELKELDGMRRTIAERLSESKRTIPHFYLSVDIELDALAAFRERINREALPARDDARRFKLSVNDLMVKALALALMAVPQANATWDNGRIRRLTHADIGVAVAVDGGLYTPVLRNVDSKTLPAISRELRALIARARARTLTPQECEGGAATISNLGMFGIDRFSAIINPPQSSILAVGAARQQVIARDGQTVIATLMSATLSCDHRVIDGALAARLLGELKLLLESPLNLFT